MRCFFLFFLPVIITSCTWYEEEKTIMTAPIEVVIKDTIPQAKPFSPLTEDCFEKGELVVLLNNSSFSYMLYKGKPRGYEYELLKMFCEDNNLTLKVKVVKDAGNILDSLAVGYGHLAAANFTINTDRKKNNNFSAPFFKTKQVLVQHLPNNWRKMKLDDIQESLIKDPLDLDNKKVTVKKNTVFYGRLKSFSFDNGLNIDAIESNHFQTTADLIELVDKQEVAFTVSDKNTAKFYEALYPDLDFNTALSLNQNIGWAVNKSQEQLLSKVNAWIKREKGSAAMNILESRYFDLNSKRKRLVKREWAVVNSGEISPYDELIKQNAEERNMDWVLLAALIFQESKFDPKAKSWVGAMGLTQVMPATGKELGVSNSNDLYKPKVSIRAGSKYLQQLIDYWRPMVKDSVEANYFALASYNTGKGHVLDARRIATRIGLDKNIWFGNVEKGQLLKSNPSYFNHVDVRYGYSIGKEPVHYVKNIVKYYARFDQYLKQKVH